MALRNAFLALFLIPAGSVAVHAAETNGNVVIIDVTKVDFPASLPVPGLCQINGVINDVWDGKAYRRGQRVSLRVPCGIHSDAQNLLPAVKPLTDMQLIDPEVLVRSKQGFAHLDDAGGLIWQPTRRPYGAWGHLGGYRVFDGALLPVRPERAS
jgi:hypothetical protein